MDWQRAKNLIIGLLFIINIALASITYYEYGDKNTLTSKQEETISIFLDNNNVEFTGKLIKKYPPMKNIVLENIIFDEDDLVNIFFKGEVVNKNLEIDGYVYIDEPTTGTLYVSEEGSNFQYLSSVEVIPTITLQEDARKLCEEVMTGLGINFSNYKIDKTYETDNSGKLILYYRDEFKGYKINSNFVRFVVNGNKIQEVNCEAHRPISFDEEAPKNIVSSDEAVLAILEIFRTNQTYSDYDDLNSELVDNLSVEPMLELNTSNDSVTTDYEELTIGEIELVYSLENTSSDGNIIYAVPYYRIYTSISQKIDEPILLDAYYLILP